MSIKKKTPNTPFGLFYIEMIIVLFFFMVASAVILRAFAAADGDPPLFFLPAAHLSFPIRTPHFRYSRLFCTRRRTPPSRLFSSFSRRFSRTLEFNFLHRFGSCAARKTPAGGVKKRRTCNFYTNFQKKKMIFCTEMTVNLFTPS